MSNWFGLACLCVMGAIVGVVGWVAANRDRRAAQLAKLEAELQRANYQATHKVLHGEAALRAFVDGIAVLFTRQ